MIQGIQVELNTSLFKAANYDIVILTSPIDHYLQYKFGKLQYRSLKFSYKKETTWENITYGTINLPQDPQYIRKCNFNIFWQNRDKYNFVQYQQPVKASNKYKPMYYVHTRENDAIFARYLKEICKTNVCPVGRLGLAKYLDMDKAVALAFDFVPIIENYQRLNPLEKYSIIQQIRKKY